jgi:tRNA modification GTPase
VDSIFALSTTPGKSGVAVIRISGPSALSAVMALGITFPLKPRFAHFCKIYHPATHDLIDSGLLLYFPAPHSFTGEDVVELQLHGSIAVINICLACLGQLPNLRMALPGEFSKRSFLNGKMDLTQAEGIADLIDAETLVQQRQAVRQIEGELARLYENWRKQLLHLLSFMEAYIDFPDEDLPQSLSEQITKSCTTLKTEISNHLNDKRRGEKLRQGLYAIIIGSPNVGKSSLLNYLAKRDVAIVSSQAGTTRDIIEVHLDIGGFPLIIADSAGLRASCDHLENEGMRRARERSHNADLKIALFDASNLPLQDDKTLELIDENTIVVINKIDQLNATSPLLEKYSPILISVTNNIGLDLLLDALQNFLQLHLTPSHDPVITRERYRIALTNCLSELGQFSLHKDIELAAEDLRQAAQSLSTITGKFEVEEILGEIFSNFCIGK